MADENQGSAVSGAIPADDTAATTATASVAPGEKNDQPVVDTTKNADGSAKTAEQIAADEKAAADKKAADEAAAKAKPQTPEEKAAAEKRAAELKELHGAPEQYGDFTMPDGVEVDKAKLEQISPVFKKLDLSQKGAQELVDFYAKTVAETQSANAEAWKAVREGWKAELKTDKEIGGEKYDAQVGLAKKALAHFGTRELQDYLDTYGGGDNPEVVRFLARVGSIITEDTVKFGKAAVQAAPADPAAAMYPSMAPKG